MNERELLKRMLTPGAVQEYGEYVDKYALSPVGKQVWRLVRAGKPSTVGDLRLYASGRGKLTPDIETYLVELDKVTPSESTLSMVKASVANQLAEDMADLCDEFVSRTRPPEELVYDIANTLEDAQSKMDDLTVKPVNDACVGFEPVVKRLSVDGETRWRLDQLNTTIGPLYPGLSIVVAGRPESAKTTFLCSEMTHLLQTSKDPEAEIVIFNNEAHGDVLRLRVMQSAIGWRKQEITNDLAGAQAEYEKWLGTKKIAVVDCHNWNIQQVETYIKRNCDLNHLLMIGFDQAVKVLGYDGKNVNGASRLQRLANKLRSMAVEYAPIMTTIWADASAEPRRSEDGKTELGQWIGQHQMDGSKTGVPGEADTIIGIGRTTRPSERLLRYFSIPKNKSLACKDDNERHVRFVVTLDAPNARMYMCKGKGRTVI